MEKRESKVIVEMNLRIYLYKSNVIKLEVVKQIIESGFDLRKTKYFTALDYAVMGNDVPKEVFEYLVHVFIKANIKVN